MQPINVETKRQQINHKIKHTEDSNDKKEFDSITDTITYLNTIAPSNKTTLCRYIESGKPYNGYICS